MQQLNNPEGTPPDIYRRYMLPVLGAFFLLCALMLGAYPVAGNMTREVPRFKQAAVYGPDGMLVASGEIESCVDPGDGTIEIAFIDGAYYKAAVSNVVLFSTPEKDGAEESNT